MAVKWPLMRDLVTLSSLVARAVLLIHSNTKAVVFAKAGHSHFIDIVFSGISNEPLWISAVVHQALVEVDEEGTEAAAATGAVAVTTAAVERPQRKVFRADHPFLFAIRNAATGDVLFLGRVVTPEM